MFWLTYEMKNVLRTIFFNKCLQRRHPEILRYGACSLSWHIIFVIKYCLPIPLVIYMALKRSYYCLQPRAVTTDQPYHENVDAT